jgi:excisionase family DNA binding protein
LSTTETDVKTKTIYTTHEVSRLLHVNPRSVINWIDQNLLPSYRTPGGHRRIRRDDLLAFLRRHQIPTPPSLMESGNFSVLIVDDEDDITQIMKAYFERKGGFQVTTVSDGISALLEVGRAKPDLLVLDIMIPGVDGVEVCRRIKAGSSASTIIIAISGQPEMEQKILDAGGDIFLTKPLDLEKLYSQVRTLLRIL